MALVQTKVYTEEDYYNLPENTRAELIDGQIYYMSAPTRIHQKILGFLFNHITNYINSKDGSCEVYPAPFAVKLFSNDDNTIVEPDIFVICDKNKLTDKGCSGAPDLVVEIVSPSTQQVDYGIKLFKYRTTGVREYWIINPITRTVNVFDFENEKGTYQYSFDDEIHVCIYEDLSIRLSDIL